MTGRMTPNGGTETYDRDGVLMIKSVLDDGQLSLISDGIEKVLSKPSKRHVDYFNDAESGQRFFYDAVLMPDVDEIYEAIDQSILGQTVAEVMKSNSATAFYVSIFSRTAGLSKQTPWHQDLPFWSASGQQACSTWIPLDPVPRPTALEFVRGSHKWDSYGRSDFSDTAREGYLAGEENRAERFPDIEANRSGFEIIGWEMSPGDCLLFHGMTAHGGSGNLPPGLARRAISIQWLGDDGMYLPKDGGVDPDFMVELEAAGLLPGGPLACKLCPKLWPRPGNT